MRESISSIVKRTRLEKNLTLRDLAAQSGVSFVEINNIELRKNNPSAKTLLKLAEALELDFDDLFHRDL